MTLSPPRNAHRPWFPPIPLGVPSQTPFLDPFLLDLKASTGGLSTLELILGSSSFLSTWPLFRILSCGLRLYLCLVSSAQEIFLKFIHRIVCINSFSPHFYFYIVFIYSPLGGHLGCVQFRAIINKATMNIKVKSLCGHSFHFGDVGGKHFFLSLLVNVCLIFWEIDQLLSVWLCHVCIPTNPVGGASHPHCWLHCQMFILILAILVGKQWF